MNKTNESKPSAAPDEVQQAPSTKSESDTKRAGSPSVVDRQWLARVALQAGVLLATLMLGIVLVGAAQRIGWLRAAGGSSATEDTHVHTAATEYTCPMHPDIRQDEPGNCPICGMELVATVGSELTEVATEPVAATDDASRYICPMMCTPPQSEPGKCPVCAMELVEAASGGGGNGSSVVIDAAARRILGIQTAQASSGDVYQTIRTVGRIAYDEERVATIAAYVDGRIEEMFAEYVGVRVATGDDLAVLYSPRLYSAQVEYLSSLSTPALDALAGDGQRLSDIARDNLKELGMSESQIDSLRDSKEAQKRLRIKSPIGGTVITKHKVEGDYVKTGESIYRVVDLSTVWLILDLYPNDAAAVRFGQQVEAELQSLPGEVYTGRVAFVDPIVNEKTRTVAVRVEMTNFDGRLKPGDYATAFIHMPAVPRKIVYDPAMAGKWISPMHPQIIRDEAGECPLCGMDLIPTSELGYSDDPLPEQNVITVPRSAVLMAGDNSVVYVESEPGVFDIRRVTLGPLTDTEAVIRDGIKVNEVVATNGNFLIDSQMQLMGNPSLMDPGRKSGRQAANTAEEAGHAH